MDFSFDVRSGCGAICLHRRARNAALQECRRIWCCRRRCNTGDALAVSESGPRSNPRLRDTARLTVTAIWLLPLERTARNVAAQRSRISATYCIPNTPITSDVACAIAGGSSLPARTVQPHASSSAVGTRQQKSRTKRADVRGCNTSLATINEVLP